jgi:hypothetical protein
MTESEPYYRLPTETNSQYLGFECYRDQGSKRNLSRAYARYLLEKGHLTLAQFESGKNPNPSRHFVRWRRDYNWDDRAYVWDLENDPNLSLYRRGDFLMEKGRKNLSRSQSMMQQLQVLMKKLS